jgi:UDP-2,4-diacetamido-2,4,6-trideoxy-beta-L-altropyranose hydrolase
MPWIERASMGTLCVRADASVAIGTGHVMRCLALAQTWQDAGGDVAFAMAETGGAIQKRLQSEGLSIFPVESAPGSIEDAKEIVELARKQGARWIVVDGYQFGERYQRDLEQAGLKVLFVDDSGHAKSYVADIVLNQNAHACAELYESRDAHTRLLLGPRYALLRREFRAHRDFQREIPAIGRKVLVTMGGSDPENLTLRMIEALALIEVDNLEATVVVGGSNPRADSLRALVERSGKIRLLCDIDNMPEWMKWADVAVSAAGSTCWEMCYLGLPAMLIDFAPNQTPVARELHRLGAALHFGDAASVVPKAIAAELHRLMMARDIRTTMSRKAKELVDGRGAQRVVSAIRSQGFCLRRVEPQDCKLLWEWANDPEARRVSFSPGTIAWEDHVAWFRQKLGDRNAVLYVAVDDEQSAVGFIRYQIKERRAVVSINVAPRFRGLGYGNAILSLANQELFRTTGADVIDAYVKWGNTASIRLFTAAGFTRQPNQTVAGQQAAYFSLAKNGSGDD